MPKKRQRKKRQTLAMVESRALKSVNTREFKAGESVPDDYWRELSTQYEQVSIRVKRHNHKGHLQTTYGGFLFEVLQMPLLDSWLSDHAGGSGPNPYLIEVRAPDEPTNMIAMFRLAIDGPVRPPIPLPKPPDPNQPLAIPEGVTFGFELVEHAGGHAAFVPTEEVLMQHPSFSPFVTDPMPHTIVTDSPGAPDMTDNVQRPMPSPAPIASPGGWAYPPGSQRVAPGLASMTSDQIAREGQQATKADLERERAERRAEQTRFEDERARMREETRRLSEQVAQAEAQRREDAHRAELKALEMKLEALAATRAAPAPVVPERNPLEMVAMVVAAFAPLVPVFQTMVASGKELQAAQLQAQSAQSTAMMTMVAADRNRPQADPLDTVTKLTALAAPLIAPLLQSRGSDAAGQAAILTAASEAQAQSTAIMAQLLGAIAESGQPEQAKSMLAEILPLLPNIGDMITSGVKAWADMNRGAQPQPPPRQLPAGAVQRPQAVQAAPSQPARQAQPAPAPQPQASAPPTTAVDTETASYEADYAAETYGAVPAEPVAVPEEPAPIPEVAGLDASGAPIDITSRPMELPGHLFDMLPAGLRNARVKGWLRSVHAGDSSQELGFELAEFIAEAMSERWLAPEHAKRVSEQPRESLTMLASMLPACIANPAYGESITGFAMERLLELASESDEDDEEEGEESERAA